MLLRSFRACLLWVALAGLLWPTAAHAGNGVVEINQAGALAGGITPGDAPGFPVTISLPGSYRLTSDLIVNDATLGGINITVEGVSLDLSGFHLVGPVSCSNSSNVTTCTSGSGTGIVGPNRVSLLHGTVRGFGTGVSLQSNSWIRDLLVTSNATIGIATTSAALVEDTRAVLNGGIGIGAGQGSLIEHCVAGENGSGGISTPFESLVIENAASFNGGAGINVLSGGSAILSNVAANNQGPGITTGVGSLVSHNSTEANTGDGIDAALGALVSDNASSFNLVNGNSGTGIVADAGSLVLNNTATNNGIDGLYLIPSNAGTHPAAYLENVMDHNAQNPSNVGFPVAGGITLGANYCDGATCP